MVVRKILSVLSCGIGLVMLAVVVPVFLSAHRASDLGHAVLLGSTALFLVSLPVLRWQLVDEDSIDAVRRRGPLQIPAEWENPVGGAPPHPSLLAMLLVRSLYALVPAALTWWLVGRLLLSINPSHVYALCIPITVASTALWPWHARRLERLWARRDASRSGVETFVYGYNVYKLQVGPVAAIAVNVIVLGAFRFAPYGLHQFLFNAFAGARAAMLG